MILIIKNTSKLLTFFYFLLYSFYMTPQEVLISFGLNEKESSVYLACLELGQDSITEISKKANVKRPTTYLIVESLHKRGLIHTLEKGRRTFYGVEEPSKLLGLLEEKERTLKTLLPYLEAIHNRKPIKPKVRFYEGREGIKHIYREMLVAPEIRFAGSMEEIMKKFKDVIDWFTQESHRRKPKVYDILVNSIQDREYAKKAIRPGYEIRFFPKDAKVFIDAMITKNKIAINAFSPEPHGFIIESEAIATSLQSLWELAWKSAVPYQAIIRKR